MKLPTLYQLTDDYLTAFAQMQEAEIPDEVIRDTLEGLAYPIEQKATGIAQMARNFESLADQIGEAVKMMQARAKFAKNRADRLNAYIKEQMERAELTQIPCPYFVLSIVKNPESVVIEDPGLIPDEYKRLPPVPDAEPDKALIKTDLKAGKLVPGCKLDRTTRLQVK